MTIGIFKELLVKYFFIPKIVFKVINTVSNIEKSNHFYGHVELFPFFPRFVIVTYYLGVVE
jgi:hypothetical protein